MSDATPTQDMPAIVPQAGADAPGEPSAALVRRRAFPPGVPVAGALHDAGRVDECEAGGRHVRIVGGPLGGCLACFAPSALLGDGDVVGLVADPLRPYLLRRDRGPDRGLWVVLHPAVVGTWRPGAAPRAARRPTTWEDPK